VEVNVTLAQADPSKPFALTITPLPKTTPSTSGSSSENPKTSVQFVIFAKHVYEVNVLGNVVKDLALDSQNYTEAMTSHVLQPDNSTVTYLNATFPLLGQATLLIKIAIYENPQNLTFANHPVDMAQNGIKYSMRVENWDFEEIRNQLVIVVESTSNSARQSVNVNQVDGGTLQWMVLSSGGFNLYAKFLEYAIIDDVVQTVRFTYVDNEGSPEVYVDVPHFWNYAEIDPNYVVLEQQDTAKNSGIPETTVIAIVASIVGAAVVVSAVLWIQFHRRAAKRFSHLRKSRDEKARNQEQQVPMDTLPEVDPSLSSTG